MKRWAILTVLLYALALLSDRAGHPVALGNWGKNDMNIRLHEGFELYLSWGYWLWLGVLVVG